MIKDNEQDETPIPRGGGDISGKSATTRTDDTSVESATEIPKGGGDVSGKVAATDPDNSFLEDGERSREIRQIPPRPVE